jgi:hypothetical protein
MYVAMCSAIDINVVEEPTASIFRKRDFEDEELDVHVSDASSPGTSAEGECGADGL